MEESPLQSPDVLQPQMQVPQTPTVATPPPAEPAPPAPAQPPQTPTHKMNPMIWMTGMGVVILALVIIVFFQWRASKQVVTAPEPTPTLAPVPTKVQELSPIASTSAFMTFTQGIATLSAQLNGFSLQDPSLTPPSLDADITFKQ